MLNELDLKTHFDTKTKTKKKKKATTNLMFFYQIKSMFLTMILTRIDLRKHKHTVTNIYR